MPLGKRSDYGDSRYAGVEVPFSADGLVPLRAAVEGGFDFLVAPLTHPARRPPPPPPTRGAPITPIFTPDQGLFLSPDYGNQVVGKVSEWIDPDSKEPAVAKASSEALKQEMGWATHLSLQGVMLRLRSADSVGFAHLTNQLLQGIHHMQVWVRVPAAPQAAQVDKGNGKAQEGVAEAEAEAEEPERVMDVASGLARADPYVWWHQFRTICDNHAALGVCLELTAELPASELLRRWMGEPLKAVIIPINAFTTNKRGYPTLSKRHQEFVADCFAHNVQIILTSAPAIGEDAVEVAAPLDDATFPSLGATPAAAAAMAVGADEESEGQKGMRHPLQSYWEYMVYLFRRMDVVDEQTRFEHSYRDYLQAPLQPLMDNLENQTYETFEKDDTKYIKYEQAVYKCLLDRVPQEHAASTVTTLMVVGAGRGPLVSASLRAAAKAKRKLKVYAVEKNPNAIITLQRILAEDPAWKNTVTLVHADMRFWEAPEQTDILVSELLGSFGDNELSPECLDGAQRFLKPDGVSIPQSYTSYLAPMTSFKLFKDCKGYKDLEHLETAYVVKCHRVALLAEPLPVFTFHHPNWATHIDNTRSIELEFEPSSPDTPSATMHGFVGYFDSKLYGDVHISTYPKTETAGMFSWFPIYFPITVPIHVPAGRKVKLHFWRCVSSSKVWYEWAVTSPTTTHCHNVNGRSYWVGL